MPDSDAERRTVRGRKRDRDKGRSRGREERKSRSEERQRRANTSWGRPTQESGDSLSDVSLSDVSTSAASISGLSVATRETGRPRAEALPGFWLKPSEQRLVQFAPENRQPRSPS
ncbi:hypothetical protein FQA47_021472 [Oryzias melastigma]|uniref:Uncharacterized protein n=1 Tax=Oryzias melastigma TaxID=30732 RepID=A0A834C1V1_ORYME|nr:hypothetical protein FQA47_021472 [Oryzias melastigma]